MMTREVFVMVMCDELREKYESLKLIVSRGVQDNVYITGSEDEKLDFVTQLFEFRILANQLSIITEQPYESFDLTEVDNCLKIVPCMTYE